MTQSTHRCYQLVGEELTMDRICSVSGCAVKSNPIWSLRRKGERCECVISAAHQMCERHQSREKDITHPSVAKAGAMTCPPGDIHSSPSILGAASLIHYCASLRLNCSEIVRRWAHDLCFRCHSRDLLAPFDPQHSLVIQWARTSGRRVLSPQVRPKRVIKSGILHLTTLHFCLVGYL